MSDTPARTPKKRKLRATGETIRERAERGAEKQSSKRSSVWKQIRHYFAFIGITAVFIGKPLKFIGHYVIPPYFRNSWKELKLVTWPNRKQTRQLTLAVIMFSVVLGTFVALLDLGFGKLFKQVIIK